MIRPAAARFVVLLASIALVAAACSDAAGEGSTTTTSVVSEDAPTTSVEEGDDEGVIFRVGVIGPITTDNWWAALDVENLPQNQAFLTNGKTSLFELSLPGFVTVPGVAATAAPVEPHQEGDLWVVEQPIRDDVMWSDGEPVTADDLVFYFDTVREFRLASSHAASFGAAVLDVSAPDEHTVRVEFSSRPGLAVWISGVGRAPFVPAHFWAEHVEAAREAAAATAAELGPEEAIVAIVSARNGDTNPDNDIDEGDVTEQMIADYIARTIAAEGRAYLYAVPGLGEPSSGPLIVDQWEPGVVAVTVANPAYHDHSTENTLYSDGSFRVANAERGEDDVYGGEGAGDVIASYLEGPFISEIQWIEHGARESAYEDLAAGELDFVYDPDGLTHGLRDQLATSPDLRFSESKTEGFRYMAFNLRKPPMSDFAFRRATATVINKESIAESALAGEVFPAYTVVHPDLTLHYNSEVDKPGWVDGAPMEQGARFEAAIGILRDAGYTWSTEPAVARDVTGAFLEVNPRGEGLTMPNGEAVPELTILTPGADYDPFRATFATQVVSSMQALGIPVIAEETDFDTIIAATFPPQTPETALMWDMYVLGWGASDPSLPGTSLRAFFHSDQDTVTRGGYNTPGYASEEFDLAANAFDAAATVGEAAQLTKDMDAIVARDLPYVVLFRTPIIEAFRDNVTFPVQSIMGGQQGYPNAWPNAVVVTETD